MSDGIKDHFESIQEAEYTREREVLLSKKVGILHHNIKEARDTLFRFLSDDRPMTKFDRTRLENALKNLQDLMK